VLTRGAVHDRQIRSAFVQFCLRHGSGSGSGICATIGMLHKWATCAGSTRTLEPHVMATTKVANTFRRTSRLNNIVPLFDYLSVPSAPFRRVVAISCTLATVSGRLHQGPKVVSSRAELFHFNELKKCRFLARLRHANCIERCPLSGVTRKTFARIEFFSVCPTADMPRRDLALHDQKMTLSVLASKIAVLG
jgi:hypothetical protein